MGWISKLLGFSEPVKKALDIADQFVLDKDAKEQLKAELEKMAQTVYMAELGTPTIKWVDALHKMGRQIQAYLAMGICTYLAVNQVPVPPELLGALAGPSSAYILAKGRGR